MSRRAWRERRRRVGALHHAEGLWAEAGASYAAAESQAAFSLAPQVREAFRRRKRRPRAFDMLRAVDLAASAVGVDPNPRVRAEFAVEVVLADSIRGAAEFAAPLARFRDGQAWTRFGVPWHGDLRRLDGVTALDPLTEALPCKLVQARWRQSPPQMWVSADCLRPPMEALVLAAQLVQASVDKRPSRVLAIGLGFDSGPFALAKRLPACTVDHLPVPFEDRTVASSGWSAVVLNLPSAGAHAFAAGLAGWEEDSRAGRILRRARRAARRTGTGHLAGYFDLLGRLDGPGTPLVMMTDPSVHHAALENLGDIATPMAAARLDTSERGVWVGYAEEPWTPSGIPSPTGRVVTLWRLS